MKNQNPQGTLPTREHNRLRENVGLVPPWRRWGPYVSERAWGTVREDYSANGDAWNYLTHDAARSRAYRWGEDGIAGICDRYQLLVFAVAFWNARDPILKERTFGLVPSEGNHGEDVKEYYFYLDNTPTHSYMKYLYKYPQSEFPYLNLIQENQRRAGRGFEYELLDTGVFDGDRYFDIFIEYAKASPEDICIKVEAFNRGPEDAPLHIIPHLWFRNTWGWKSQRDIEPRITEGVAGTDYQSLLASDCASHIIKNLPFMYRLGSRYLYAESDGESLFTNNETNPARAPVTGTPSSAPFYKDAFHRYIVNGEALINPARFGTKAAINYARIVPAGGSVVLKFRLTDQLMDAPLKEIEEVISLRKQDADEFYEFIHPPNASEDECRIQRQAFAGLLWTKQFYCYDVQRWLDG